MPYQKTKEGRLVNEVTLGDGYPLSNDKQPLKVGGEASIINVSSPTPDGSVDGELEVKGKLKAKDTFIQGDLKVFSDSDTSPQFRFESRAGQNCQLQVKSAANTLTQLQLNNNQGSWYLKRKSSTTSLEFNDGTNTPLILDGDNVEFTNLTDGSITIDSFVDEDNMSSNSATKIPTQQSVKSYVDNEVAGLVDSAPAALDTLNELAAALNDDASFSTTITNSLATKVGLTGDETIAGNKTFSGLVKISAGGPQLIFVDTTDDDDHKIQFWDESNNVVHIIRTSDNTGGGLGDSLCIGSVENKPLQFITQDTTRMVIDGSGRVGIGVTDPDSKVEIIGEGTSNSTHALYVKNSSNTNLFYVRDDGVVSILGGYLFAQHANGIYSTGSIKARGGITDDGGALGLGGNGNTDDMTISSGNVGIGTASPDTPLHVIGETSIQPVNYAANQDAFLIKGGAANNDAWDGHVGVKMKSNSGGTPYLTLRGTNNDTLNVISSKVGIGTTSPTTTLDVNGTANFSDDVTLPDSKKIYLGNGNDLEIHHNGSNSVIKDNGTGDLSLQSNGAKVSMYDAANGAFMAKFNTGAGVELFHNGTEVFETTNTGVNIEGTVSYKHVAVTASSDAVDVSGATVVECTPSGNISIGGFSGGVQGQVIHVLKVDSGFGRVFLEHNESTGTQKIFLSGGSDVAITQRGGVTCYCTGSEWIVLDK